MESDALTPGTRVLTLVLAGALAFACVVMVMNMLSLGDTPTCADVQARVAEPNEDGECYYDSSTAKMVQMLFGWLSGALAGLAALVGLYYAFTGLRSRLLLQLTAAAIAFGAVSIVIGVL